MFGEIYREGATCLIGKECAKGTARGDGEARRREGESLVLCARGIIVLEIVGIRNHTR